MKKVLALAGVFGSPLLLALPIVAPKLAVLLLVYLTSAAFTGALIPVVLPLLVIGLLGFLGQPVGDSLLFIL